MLKYDQFVLPAQSYGYLPKQSHFMKKFILSAFTVLAFAFYIVYQRFGWGSSVLVVPDMMRPTKNSGTDMMKPPMMASYRDGEYAGISADAFYGRVEVVAIISGGRIVEVKFLDYPKEAQTSVQISGRAVPMLQTEAIEAQSAEVDIVSGATETSLAFRESLASALAKAKF